MTPSPSGLGCRVWTSSGFHGEPLAIPYRENIGEPAILEIVSEFFARYATEREVGERFGDFLWRAGLIGMDAVLDR